MNLPFRVRTYGYGQWRIHCFSRLEDAAEFTRNELSYRGIEPKVNFIMDAIGETLRVHDTQERYAVFTTMDRIDVSVWMAQRKLGPTQIMLQIMETPTRARTVRVRSVDTEQIVGYIKLEPLHR